jgi:hypothetical protein
MFESILLWQVANTEFIAEFGQIALCNQVNHVQRPSLLK